MNTFTLAKKLGIELKRDGEFRCPHNFMGFCADNTGKIDLWWAIKTCDECSTNYKALMATREGIKRYENVLKKLARE